MPIDVTQLIPQLRRMQERTPPILAYRQAQMQRMQQVFEPGFDVTGWEAVCSAAANLTGVRWAGALFIAGEPINRYLPFGREPDAYALIAADGSQIMPDRHKAVQYAAIQVACTSIVYGRAGNPRALEDATRASRRKPLVFMGEDEFIDAGSGEYVSPGQISTERDLREIEFLAEQCERFRAAGLQPIAVADGSLVPFTLLNEPFVRNSPREAGEQLARVTRALDRMRNCGALVAGYIDRPNSNALARSCALAGVPAAARHDEVLLRQALRDAERGLIGIMDRHVLEPRLPGHHRTALFEPAWLINGDAYLGRFGHTMRCCYMNSARDDSRPQLARLEMPAWCTGTGAVGGSTGAVGGSTGAVGGSTGAVDGSSGVDVLAAVMGRHARMGGGYPLCLKAAHEEAVITREDEREVDRIIERHAVQRGVLVTPSAKQEAKDKR